MYVCLGKVILFSDQHSLQHGCGIIPGFRLCSHCNAVGGIVAWEVMQTCCVTCLVLQAVVCCFCFSF